jgi:hypothetical protein
LFVSKKGILFSKNEKKIPTGLHFPTGVHCPHLQMGKKSKHISSHRSPLPPSSDGEKIASIFSPTGVHCPHLQMGKNKDKSIFSHRSPLPPSSDGGKNRHVYFIPHLKMGTMDSYARIGNSGVNFY